MQHRHSIIFIFFLVLAVPLAAAIECSAFNASNIKLVSFDVFAALMDTPTSLIETVSPILNPFGVDTETAERFVDGMLEGYSNYADHVFTRQETGGVEPFQFVTNSSLTALLQSFHLPIAVDSPPFLALLECWSRLRPWPGVVNTISAIARAGIRVAPLSNGASYVLKQAWANAFPDVALHEVFSSDWPVGAFKPQAAMYQQLLSPTGLSAAQVMHVAGAPIDGQGGRLAGVLTALAWNQPLPGVPPCFALANITSLLDILHLKA
jgi:2-haloalkanoic acid dehalogenase type II